MFEMVLVTLFVALLSPWLVRCKIPAFGWILASVPFCLFILLCAQIPGMLHGDTVAQNIGWLAPAGVTLSFYLDGLSLFFALLITGIGTLIVIYSHYYLRNHPQIGRYYAYLFLFMGSMLASVLANNLILLFIAWELTSLSSYLLISFHHEKVKARKAAFQGLYVTATGGIALFVGLVMMGEFTGTYSITHLFALHGAIVGSHFYMPIVLLVLLGAFTKSAQFPFHFWLPNAMEAPTPVSAYLHSATMVKLGIYLLARFTPILGHTLPWSVLLYTVGAATMLVGAVLALRAEDLKRILAYSTVMALGTLVFLLASGNRLTTEAAMVFLLAHALYKGALFLCAGNIEHATGTRLLRYLGGLSRKMPLTFIAVLLAAASFAGLPPMLGFISKEIFYEAKLAAPDYSWLLISIAFITNMIFVVIALMFAIKPFFGKDKRKEVTPAIHDVNFGLWLPPLILGGASLLFGLLPALIDNQLIAPATSGILQQKVSVDLALWHGLTPSLYLSLFTYLFAIPAYLVYPWFHRGLKRATFITLMGPNALYNGTMLMVNAFCCWLNNITQKGYLRIYTSIVFITLIVFIGFSFLFFKHLHPKQIIPDASWYDWLIALIMAIAAFATAAIASYIASLTFLSIIGLGSTLIFLLYSAPDVAMTQLLVDVLTIVIVVLALYQLPQLPNLRRMSNSLVVRNAIIAIIAGLLITAILLSIISVPFNRFISDYYSQHAYSIAQGRNVVNVILVDFRAYDTLGEAIVIAMAGLGVYGLLKTPRVDRRDAE
jgi:multicomponent Na+:H+ antiporter subunit A